MENQKQEILQSVVASIKEFVAIESVESEPKEGMPFGSGVAEALSYILSLASDMGFATKNYDNYAGEVVWGEGERTLGILCHVDVVPAGKTEMWKHPPFEATEEDGKLYGRGTMDDKGPAIICLYAMKALRDEGFVPRQKIKLILGCDEESGWECMKHYKKVAEMPDYGFSPDGNFPVIYAEKGILHLRFSFASTSFLSIIGGGERPNMVCDDCFALALVRGKADTFKLTLGDSTKAKYLLPVDKELVRRFGLSVHADGSVSAKGKSAHASTPEKGVNAMLPVLNYLEAIGAIGPEIREIFFEDSLGLTELHDKTGYLTMCPSMIEKDEHGGNILLTVDLRCPASIPLNEILRYFDKAKLHYTVLERQESLLVSPDHPLVTTLLGVYNRVLGKNSAPIAIGGGTYARALPVGVAFGPEPEDEESTVHEPNEYISLAAISSSLEVYREAIRELTENP